MLTATQVAAIIMLLNAFGVSSSVVALVQSELTQPTVQIPQAQTAPTSVPSASLTYAPVSVAQYTTDPLGYLGKPIIITGMVNTLMPRTGNSGSTNYIQIINPFDPSQPKVQLEVDDNSAYSASASSLQDKSSPILQFVQAYGTAVSSQAFTMTTLFGSQKVMLPVVNITRIDKCLHGSMNTTVLTGSSFDENFKCSSWITLSPSTTAIIPAPVIITPAPQTTTPATPAPASPVLLSSCTISYVTPDISVTKVVGGWNFNVPWTVTNASEVDLTSDGGTIYVPLSLGLPKQNGNNTSGNYFSGTLTENGNYSTTARTYALRVHGMQGYSDSSCSVVVPPYAGISIADATPTPLDSDTTLKTLTVNGTPVSGFSASTYTYTILLPAGALQAPSVTAVPNDSVATDVITQAANSLGTAAVVVTAQNGTTRSYTLNFRPSDAGQCNFNGNIFYCASNPGITVSPTSLPNATVGTSYSQMIAISDPDTSSQNFKWNIISGIFPPGLGFAFSPTMAFECSGTYCFFTSPPSNVSVPANTPGMFFGTPTAAGTYTFTLQTIDNLNYIALPTFTLTVANTTGNE